LGGRGHYLSQFFSIGNQYGTWIKGELRQTHPRYFGKIEEIQTRQKRDNIEIRPKGRAQIKRSINEYWIALFLLVGGDDKTQVDALALSDVFEFFTLLKVHESNQVKKVKQLNKIHKQ